MRAQGGSGPTGAHSPGSAVMNYWKYARQMFAFVLSSSLTLGLVAGVAMLISGKLSMNIDLDVDIGAYDGLAVIVGLPAAALLLFLLLSPVSFWLHRLLWRRGGDGR
jgi:hypothetical protein